MIDVALTGRFGPVSLGDDKRTVLDLLGLTLDPSGPKVFRKGTGFVLFGSFELHFQRSTFCLIHHEFGASAPAYQAGGASLPPDFEVSAGPFTGQVAEAEAHALLSERGPVTGPDERWGDRRFNLGFGTFIFDAGRLVVVSILAAVTEEREKAESRAV